MSACLLFFGGVFLHLLATSHHLKLKKKGKSFSSVNLHSATEESQEDKMLQSGSCWPVSSLSNHSALRVHVYVLRASMTATVVVRPRSLPSSDKPYRMFLSARFVFLWPWCLRFVLGPSWFSSYPVTFGGDANGLWLSGILIYGLFTACSYAARIVEDVRKVLRQL